MEEKQTALERLESLARARPLTDDEARRLVVELNRVSVKVQKPWTSADIARLKRYLERGKKPAFIAAVMNRTERAVWRKIYKEGLAVGLLCPDAVYTSSRIRVQSRRAR